MKRVLTAIAAEWRVAWMTALQYRSNFVIELIMTLFWLGWTVLPLVFVFGHRTGIAGWTFDQSLVVTGFFVMLQGLEEGLVDPNLRNVVEQVRQGTLDFVLLKPIDAQILVSFSRTVPAKIVHVIGGAALTVYAAQRLDHVPGAADIALSLTLLASGTMAMYGLWLMVVSTSFWFVRIDNLSYLLSSAMDAARWPVSMYRTTLRVLLTFVVPVGLMTTYPALALRGVLGVKGALIAVGVAVAFVFVSRRVWRVALSRYASASS